MTPTVFALLSGSRESLCREATSNDSAVLCCLFTCYIVFICSTVSWGGYLMRLDGNTRSAPNSMLLHLHHNKKHGLHCMQSVYFAVFRMIRSLSIKPMLLDSTCAVCNTVINTPVITPATSMKLCIRIA